MFLHLEKKYDKPNRYGLQNVWPKKMVYDENKECMRINETFSKSFSIERAVGQGCLIFSWLFSIFRDKCIIYTRRDVRSVLVGELYIKYFHRYNTMLLARCLMLQRFTDLQQMLDCIIQRIQVWRLICGRPKSCVWQKNNGVNNCRLYINDENLEQGDEFVHFNNIFTKNGKMDGEILRCANVDWKIANNI